MFIKEKRVKIVDEFPVNDFWELLKKRQLKKKELNLWKKSFDPKVFLRELNLQNLFDQRLVDTLGDGFTISQGSSFSDSSIADSIVKYNEEIKLLIEYKRPDRGVNGKVMDLHLPSHSNQLLHYAAMLSIENLELRILPFILTDGWSVYYGEMKRDEFSEMWFTYWKRPCYLFDL